MTPGRAAVSRSRLPTRPRKTLSNLGAGLRTPGDQWAEELVGGRPAEGGASRGAGRDVGAPVWDTVLEAPKTWPGPRGEARPLPPDSPATPLGRVQEWRGPRAAERDPRLERRL